MEAKLLIGFCIAGSISLPAWRFRALDGSGAIAALVMGTVVFGLGGLMPSIALVLFFVSGSILSALPDKTKVRTDDESFGRSWKQVFANGSVAAILILAATLFPAYHDKLLVIAIASIASAAADSWSTEIGSRYGGAARDILTRRIVPTGISGGVSVLGLFAAILGGLFVAVSTYSAGQAEWPKSLVAVTIAAFMGAISDSVIGSGLQGKYRCETCGELTETGNHCNSRSIIVKGKVWIDNNVVNFAATAIGAIFCALELDFVL